MAQLVMHLIMSCITYSLGFYSYNFIGIAYVTTPFILKDYIFKNLYTYLSTFIDTVEFLVVLYIF